MQAQDQAPAFPGAEGFGRYVTGGRGGKIVHVTNLNDSGEGSLRQAVSGSVAKIVVFDVSGIIELKSDLGIGANTTIAGQTAPGDGITLRYYTVHPNASNVIIRFIRSRRGEEVDVNDGADAIWTRQQKGLILDHCSFSWGIDELASFYDNQDFTMQWCSLGEGLANPGHSKGEHSYGGIWGGKHASFHHNFLCHIQNRAPRFNGARYGWDGYDKTEYENTVQAERVDFRNCVMYNWGNGNGCYGGSGGGYINIVNNYYKAGPGTVNKTRVTQISVATSSNADKNHPELYGLSSRYYINGNYVTAAKTPENWDWSGVSYDGGLVIQDGERYIKDPNGYFGQDSTNIEYEGVNCVRLKLIEPIESGDITTHSAESAFDKVLMYCGASLSRDIVDTRYFDEAATGTCTYTGSVSKRAGIIDFVHEQGEYTLASTSRPDGFDTDRDGMPDEWELANGLDPNDPSDANLYTIDTEKGWYTNVEVYINSLVEHIMKGGNEGAIDVVDEYYPKCSKSGKDSVGVYTVSSTIATGNYLLYTPDKIATPLDMSMSYGYIPVVDATVVDGTITTSKANQFTITAVDGGYTIQDPDARYYYMTGSYNSFNLSEERTDGDLWTITPNNDGTVLITNMLMQKTMQFDPNYNSYGAYPDERGLYPTLYLYAKDADGEVTVKPAITLSVPQIGYDGRYVQITTDNEGARIHFTTDGSTPTASSATYTSPFDAGGIVTVKAIAAMDNCYDSDMAELTNAAYYDGETVTMGTPGHIAEAFGWTEPDNITALRVTGQIDSDDLAYINLNLTNISALDLSGATAANIPDRAYAGTNYTTVKLPKADTMGKALFAGCDKLCAVYWDGPQALTDEAMAETGNPNLLLYVSSAGLAPSTVANVVAAGEAKAITVTDGHPFYCPEAFWAELITYTHTYTQQTAIGSCAGWETLALPFTVQTVSHESRGEISPFAAQRTDLKQFWLYAMGGSGFAPAQAIEANTPYLISMPNNSNYVEDYNLPGAVTFESHYCTVPRTEAMTAHSSTGVSFVPAMATVARSHDVYALNVHDTNITAGSRFVSNLRAVSPFEAYLTGAGAMRAPVLTIDELFGGDVTGICIPTADLWSVTAADGILYISTGTAETVALYTPDGTLVRMLSLQPGVNTVTDLQSGLYIIKGCKVLIRK